MKVLTLPPAIATFVIVVLGEENLSARKEAALAAEIKRLKKEANRLNTPSTFSRSALLTRTATAKEKELNALKAQPSRIWWTLIRFVLPYTIQACAYVLLVLSFRSKPVVILPVDVVYPFGLTAIPPAVLHLSELSDLSLAGNQIKSIPPEIANLSKLRRLGLAGNRLQRLPPEIGHLTQLEGLWLHGNLLHELPDEIGHLTALRFLALAGNQLTRLPHTLGRLTALQVLSVAGNQLEELPQSIGSLASLRVLAAYGNALTALPPSITHLSYLQELFLQGNRISSLPPLSLRSLRQLSLADNCLSAIPQGTLAQLPFLESLWLYGNSIAHLPPDLADCSRLANLWLEGNPLSLSHTSLSDTFHRIKTVGVDSQQLVPSQGMQPPLPSNVLVSRLAGTGAAQRDGGYFKVQPWQHVNSASEAEGHRSEVLVVAFGSAPAVPNWAGLLRKVKGDMGLTAAMGGTTTPFDTLYVVDSTRSWYTHAPLSTLTSAASNANLAPPPMLSHVGAFSMNQGSTG
ncbi:unnamed protein product [Closterium sp. NIES-65]|nr:unnamed protein product [Closterium sp. NIES-65]